MVAIKPRETRPWRDLALFVLCPGSVALAAVLILQHWPPAYVATSQAAALSLLGLALFMAVGGLGVFLSSGVGLPGAPGDVLGWRRLLLWSAGIGLALGLVMIAIDDLSGLSVVTAHRLGVKSIHIPFPASLAVYSAAAVVVECFYRLAPIPILMWLIGWSPPGKRNPSIVFWCLAILTSLIEPLSQAVLFRDPALIAAFCLLTFGVNLEEAHLLRRFGWPAPLVTRLVFYMVWHVVWPTIAAGV
jgi:hypothetical protein